jgi:phage shock protein PspC (stress-responsive transcriptional regulator)
MPNARLTRSDTDRLLAGVCGGIAAYLGLDSTLVRLAFVVLLLASGIGLPMYLILWLIMPLESHVDSSGSAIMHDNMEEMGLKVSNSMNQLGRPGTVGVILVALGGFFLLTQLGFNSSLLWPALFIGLGVYWLTRHNHS